MLNFNAYQLVILFHKQKTKNENLFNYHAENSNNSINLATC